MKPLYALPSFFFSSYIVMLLTFVRTGIRAVSFFRFYHHYHVCISPLTQACRMSRPSHSSFGSSTNIVWCVQITVIIMHFSPLSCYRKSDPNIFRSTLFLQILSLCSFFNMTDYVSHPYKLTTVSLPQNVTSNIRMVIGER